jgi:hypothetical protein
MRLIGVADGLILTESGGINIAAKFFCLGALTIGIFGSIVRQNFSRQLLNPLNFQITDAGQSKW